MPSSGATWARSASRPRRTGRSPPPPGAPGLDGAMAVGLHADGQRLEPGRIIQKASRYRQRPSPRGSRAARAAVAAPTPTSAMFAVAPDARRAAPAPRTWPCRRRWRARGSPRDGGRVRDVAGQVERAREITAPRSARDHTQARALNDRPVPLDHPVQHLVDGAIAAGRHDVARAGPHRLAGGRRRVPWPQRVHGPMLRRPSAWSRRSTSGSTRPTWPRPAAGLAIRTSGPNGLPDVRRCASPARLQADHAAPAAAVDQEVHEASGPWRTSRMRSPSSFRYAPLG